MNPSNQYFKCDCPRCGAKSVGFKSVGYLAHSNSRDWFAECGLCYGGIVVRIPGHLRLEDARRVIPEMGMIVAPSLPPTTAPEHVPDDVARYFEEGMENLPRNWNAAGMMFRKTLEVALKRAFPDIEGGLAHRIHEGSKAGLLTSDMADWAHQNPPTR